MSKKGSTLILTIVLIFALSACNLPESGSATEETTTPEFSLTLTALALQPATATGVQNTPTTSLSATPEFTPTPAVPQVTVSVNTNCRTGPSTQYDLIGALLVGQVGIVVGKNTQTGYWIINNPGKTGTCWLYNGYATVSGNTAGLQEYAIPPTPTPSATPTPTATATLAIPAPVNNPTMAIVCVPDGLNFKHSGVLSWEDKSNNEDGFNIYVNGTLIASIPANSTSHNVPPGASFGPGLASIFGVEAFNGAGKAAIKTVTKGCP